MRSLYTAVCCLFVALIFPQALASSAASNTVSSAESASTVEKRVLLLYSYHPTFPTTPKVLEGFLSEFNEQPLVVEVEYMDSKRLYTQASLELFRQNLALKLTNRDPYDVVVVADDNALNFVLKEGQELFPDTPIVFLGVNNLKLASKMASHPMVTGVVEAVSIKETIELAKKLFPDTKAVHVIADGTTSGASDLKSILALQSAFPELLFPVINLIDLSWDEFSAQVASIPPTDVVLLLSAFRDREQISLSFEKSLELIIASSPVAVFHPFEHGMGDGVFGGMIISHREQAKQAALKVKQIFSGYKVSDIPVLDKSPNILVVDKRQMDRFGISLFDLPQNVEVRYHKESVLIRYWQEITVLAIIMLLMAIIIVILAHQNRIRAKLAHSLTQSEKRLKTILDNIDAYIYMKDAKGKFLFVNRMMTKLFDMPAQRVISKSEKELFSSESHHQQEVIDLEVIEGKQIYRKEEHIWNQQLKMQRELHTTKIPLLDDEGKTYALCGVSLDITEQKKHERQLQQIAHFDPLTGLPNRVLFSDRLAQAMNYVQRYKGVLSVLYLDLDGFKTVNDTYGHIFGDQLLKVVTERINQIIRSNDTAARLGGDEFIVLLVNSGEPEDDLEITQRILSAVSQPIYIEGTTVSVSASIGITRFPQVEEVEADHLLRQADQAMYIAKNSGRNQFHFFNSELEKAALKQEALITEIKRALENNEFRLFYQPKVSLESGHVTGMEALIRWQHPERGLIPPAAFLPDIEKHNLMIDIDDWVVTEALRQMEEWQNADVSLKVSINLSHMYFMQQNLVQVLTRELEGYPNVPAPMLELEILETQALDNLKNVAQVIRECQKLGVSFALDDFGTGFSSLTYLKQLPINMLKVDRSFVSDMLVDEEDRSILQGILALCQAFDINAIAEGLETVEHGVELKKMGYRYAQGYGIAKPIPAEEVIHWLESWQTPAEWNCYSDTNWSYKI